MAEIFSKLETKILHKLQQTDYDARDRIYLEDYFLDNCFDSKEFEGVMDEELSTVDWSKLELEMLDNPGKAGHARNQMRDVQDRRLV